MKTTWPGYVFVNHLVFDVYLSELKFNLLFLYFDEMINKQWYIKGSCLNVKKKTKLSLPNVKIFNLNKIDNFKNPAKFREVVLM